MSMLVPLSPVFEAYFGKPSEFKKIEKLLEPVISKCHDAASINGKHTDINSMSEIAQIERILTEFFNVNETSISFYVGSSLISGITSNIPIAGSLIPPSFNAFTMPSGFAYFKKDPHNPKMARSTDLFVNINIDVLLVHHLDLKPDELLAIMLHEIGHVFDASYWGLVADIFTFALNPMTLVIMTIANTPEVVKNVFQNVFKTILRFSEKVPAFKILNNAIESTILTISPLFPITKILYLPATLMNALLLPYNLSGYAGEKFADSFASSYGYAEPLSRTFNRLENEEYSKAVKFMQDTKILNIGHDLSKTFMRTILFALDVHPDNAARVQHQLNKLRRDIKDPNLSPKIRKELEDQIKSMENLVDNIMTSKENAKEKGLYFTTLFNYITMKTFKGKCDPRELIELMSKTEL